MILLSEEKIISMVTDFHFSGETNRHILSKQIASAQLKKVVDYLDTLEFFDDWGGESGKSLRDQIKQAILEGVE